MSVAITAASPSPHRMHGSTRQTWVVRRRSTANRERMIAYKTVEASEMTLHPAKRREETRDQVARVASRAGHERRGDFHLYYLDLFPWLSGIGKIGRQGGRRPKHVC